jgi:hypothetical protein
VGHHEPTSKAAKCKTWLSSPPPLDYSPRSDYDYQRSTSPSLQLRPSPLDGCPRSDYDASRLDDCPRSNMRRRPSIAPWLRLGHYRSRTALAPTTTTGARLLPRSDYDYRRSTTPSLRLRPSPLDGCPRSDYDHGRSTAALAPTTTMAAQLLAHSDYDASPVRYHPPEASATAAGLPSTTRVPHASSCTAPTALPCSP